MNTWNQFQSHFGGAKLSRREVSQLYQQYGAGLGSLPPPPRRPASARDREDLRKTVLTSQAVSHAQVRARAQTQTRAPVSQQYEKQRNIMKKYNAMYSRAAKLPDVPEPMIQEDDLYN